MKPARLIAFAVREDTDPLFLEGRQQHMVVEPVLLIDHPSRTINDPRQLIGRGLTSTRGERGFDVRRNPHLEKFIQVGRNNAQVAQTLQQGNVLAPCPIKHTFIEGQDAQIAVEQRRQACRHFAGMDG